MKTAREIKEALRGFEDLFDEEGNLFINDVHTGKTLDVVVERLITEAVEAEREACAQIAAQQASILLLKRDTRECLTPYCENFWSDRLITARDILTEIRARTPAKGDGK